MDFDLEQRLRHAFLMEYLTGRKIREDGWRHQRQAERNDARRLDNEQLRREAGSFVLHDHNADRADLDRIWSERDLTQGRSIIETAQRFRHVLRHRGR